jgi:hypothetical protein
VPFLRLTRDRRGIENTFLLHDDHAGGRPRLLYWYRTAPGIVLGRPPLDEEAIHTIEDNHPEIDFDWPAILALSEVMTPEDEVVPAKPKRKPRRDREEPSQPSAEGEVATTDTPAPPAVQRPALPPPVEADAPRATPGLLEELVGREIATRLRGRYAEIRTLVYEREADQPERDLRLGEVAPLDPDGWDTPEAILNGVRGADELFERLRAALQKRQ